MIVSTSFIGIHAGPPRAETTKKQIINISSNPDLARELTQNRIKRPYYPAGYGKIRDQSTAQNVWSPKIDAGDRRPYPAGPLRFNLAERRLHQESPHHLQLQLERPGNFRPGSKVRMIPLTYPAEPLTRLINRLRA